MPGDDLQIQRDLLVKNWELIQKILESLSERSWKVKAWGVTIWWAVVGYATTKNHPELLIYLLVFVGLVFVIDASGRSLEESLLARNYEIEKALNAAAAGDRASLAAATITTDVNVAELGRLDDLFRRRRLGFWLPYVALALMTAVIALFSFLQK